MLEPQADNLEVMPPIGDIALRVELESAALVGAAIVDQNFRESRDEIPGSTVRGAVGFALRELLDDPDGDDAMQTLLASETGAHFGFLYPGGDRDVDGAIGPLPITASACKRHGREHGIVDSLLDRLALCHAASASEAERAMKAARTDCPKCQAPLRGASGTRAAQTPPRRRTITRVSLDRTRQSAREGALFTQILVDRGTVFTGTIRNVPEKSRARLAQALQSGIVSFGRGRSSGWGRATIEIGPAPAPMALSERGAAFERALKARLDSASLSTARVGHLVPVTLLSPLWSPEGATAAEVLCAALPGARCFLRARRFVREGSWDQRTGTMTPFWATAAGGVFVLELDSGWRNAVNQLAELEQRGVGQRRDQGYGELICFDPHFLAAEHGKRKGQ